MAKIVAKVISQKGTCSAGHSVGDEVVFDWEKNEVNGKICLHALYSIMPKVYAYAFGADITFAKADDGANVARHACPDGYNPVIFELRRQ